MGSSCRYGELMQVWGAHAGMGSSCRYGELMQVWGAHAGMGSSCRYGELMQVWGAHAGMGSSCRYGELDHAGIGSCMSCSKGADVLGEILELHEMNGVLVFVVCHVQSPCLSPMARSTLIIDTQSSLHASYI